MFTKWAKILLAIAITIAVGGCDNTDGLSSSGSSSSTSSTTSTTTTTTTTVQLGSGTGTSFQAGVLSVTLSSLSAGGTTTVNATLVDSGGNLYTTPVDVTFTSTCTAQNLATLDSPVTSNSGSATSTYTATGCSGTDTITAQATVNGTALTATVDVTVQSASAGSIQFISSTPDHIGIKGTGAVESSVVLFKVLDTTGSPLANQDVTFALSTTVGGITLSTTTGTSDSFGQVSTIVNSGTVSTSVSVTATLTNNTAIATQSDGLVISTGVAANDHFSISADMHNPEAWAYDNEQVNLTVIASDHFGNPVPDGAIVYFTAEGGQIQPTCTMTGGQCSVAWTSADRRPSDGRVTVTATMQGEEGFSDQNGNGLLDDGETYTDLPEAFMDYNENGSFDTVTALQDSYGNTYYEEFRDFNTNNSYDGPDGQYNGVLCNPSNTTIICSSTKRVDVRQSTVLTMSGSFVAYETPSPLMLSSTAGTLFDISLADLHHNPMPSGTAVVVSLGSNSALSLMSSSSIALGDSTAVGGSNIQVMLKVTDILKTPSPGSDTLHLAVTTPKNNTTDIYYTVTW